MALQPGDKFGPYQLIAPCGKGGMGEVWKARDTRLDRIVAMKFSEEKFSERFEREAKAISSLNHANICTVYDVGPNYLVMEYIEGTPLKGPLPLDQALKYASQICDALDAAHKKGITHRDLKPANILVTKAGIKLLDFGLARLSTAAQAAKPPDEATLTMALTGKNEIVGTLYYMSPEQLQAQASGQEIDGRSDIFSFGLVLYEMLTGKRAFDGSSPASVIAAIMERPAPSIAGVAPPALDRVLKRCLEKDPDARWQSARDVKAALELVTEGFGAARDLPVTSLRSWLQHWASRTMLAVIILVLPLAAWILTRRTEHGDTPHFHQVTFRRGLITGARFADEGKTIVYSAAWDGKPAELFSTQESSPESRPMGMTNTHVASISRNGEMALILSPLSDLWMLPASGTLARAPVSGGAAREVAENVIYADWSPDGTQLAAVRQVFGGQVLEYPLGKKLYQTAGGIFFPKVSPKGDSVAFLESGVADFTGPIIVVDTSGKKRMVSTPVPALFGLDWSPDGSEIWFTGVETGANTTLQALDMNGKVRVLAPLPGLFSLMDTAPNGRVLLMQNGFVASLYVHRANSPEEVDRYWHDNSVVRDISPDRSEILFSEGGQSLTTSDWDTYLRKVDGSPAIRLGAGLATAFSPDGKWAMTNESGQLRAYPTRAGDVRPLTSGEIRYSGGGWLHDGSRIVSVGNKPGHLLQFWLHDSPMSPPRPISGENIEFDRYSDKVVESPDGMNLAATVPGQGIQLLPIETGTAHTIPGTNGFRPVTWCQDGDLLVYRLGEVPVKVLRVDPRSGKQRPWKELAPRDRTALGVLGPIRFAPDCETYAYTAQYDPSTLTVLTGVR